MPQKKKKAPTKRKKAIPKKVLVQAGKKRAALKRFGTCVSCGGSINAMEYTYNQFYCQKCLRNKNKTD